MENASAIPVTATGSIVGFAHGGHYGHGDRRYEQHYGVSDKDQGFASTVEANERTRDVLSGQRLTDHLICNSHTDTQVAVEKVGAASVLASEKIGAAAVLTAEKVGAAGIVASERNATMLQVQAERIRADQAAQSERINLAQTMALSNMRLEQQKQACEIEAKIAECCCKLEARMLEIDAHRVRDDLAQARAELLALSACKK